VDAVRFLVSANVGEEPRELDKVASGGEVSRIALAVKTCIESERPGAAQHLLVFDEVDAGIGGEAAESVGRRLKALSRSNQVLCVTHQANIAAFANHHYRVEKQQSNGRTVAVMTELTGEERTREIGRMLSGQRLTPEALRHAAQLIEAGAAS
jgi:DNA repair protein RecN (Recombination protein N)